MVRVRLSDFTRVDALTLDTGENYSHSAVIDLTKGYAYFSIISPTTIVQIDLGYQYIPTPCADIPRISIYIPNPCADIPRILIYIPLVNKGY